MSGIVAAGAVRLFLLIERLWSSTSSTPAVPLERGTHLRRFILDDCRTAWGPAAGAIFAGP